MKPKQQNRWQKQRLSPSPGNGLFATGPSALWDQTQLPNSQTNFPSKQSQEAQTDYGVLHDDLLKQRGPEMSNEETVMQITVTPSFSARVSREGKGFRAWI